MLLLIKFYHLLVFLIINIVICDKLPIILKQPKDLIIINETESLSIDCEIESKSSISWFKDGNLIDFNLNNKYKLLSNNALLITSINVNTDSGVYYCKAENQYGSVYSNNATVIVTFLKDDFRSMPRNRQVNVGTNTILECKAPRGLPDPVIWWEKDGLKISIDDKHYLIDDNSLQIINITTFDSGQYSCVAKNEAGMRRTRSAHLNVYDKPNFIRKPQSNKYQLNSKIELVCEAKGFPEPQIEWSKDNSNDIIKKGNVLVIQNSRIEDEGEYKCKAINNLGVIEAKARVIIYEKPSFLKVLPNYTIGFESKSLTIECNARGYPPPVIYWAKSTNTDLSKNNQNSQDDFIILENGNLFIERLSKKYEGTYLCQANNEYGSIEMKTVLQVKQIQTKPPPIILYGPQNQTIAINTQAILECKTTGSESKPIIIWYKGSQQITNQQFETRKYVLEESGSLVINSVQKSDSDIYKCVVTNSFGQTISSGAILKIEDPNDPYVEFKRNYDTSALPSPCSQPTILTITSNSIQLTWQPSSYSGRSRLVSYRIEYFSPEWPRNSLGWVVLADDIAAHTNFYTVNNLQSDTYYLFIVRARNEQGFGAPSPISDLVKTLFEPQTHFREKNSNELLEKALSGEIIQLNEPDVLSSTSLNITWRVLKSAYLIEGFILKYKQIGTSDYKIEKINESKRRSFVLNNLFKFSTYEIVIEPFTGVVHGSESNPIQAKTKEDVPEHSPLNLTIELESTTSISIKWQPPPFDKTNGIILGYKINCIANETKYNIHLNTSSSTRAIILDNLIEGMKYCIKVAAYTKVGTGPFTQPFKCIEMAEINLTVKERTYVEKIRDIIVEPWFIAISIILCIMIIALVLYCFWFIFRKMSKKRNYGSSTSSETTLSTNKTNNGTRYKLVNDAVWMDTLHSSHHSNQECCCVPDIHQQLFAQKQSDTSNNVLHDINVTLENRLKNSFRNTLLLKQNDKTTSSFNTNTSNSNKTIIELQQQCLMRQNSIINNTTNNSAPQYAEIYSANHYASTGLFLENNNSISSNNLENSNTNTNSTIILNNNNINTEKKHKSIVTNAKLINPVVIKYDNGMNREITEKELLKYLQATQSQTNTPRIPMKCMQSIQRFKSLENQNRYGIENKTSNMTINNDSVKIPNATQQRHQQQIIEDSTKINNNMIQLIQPAPPPPPRMPPPNLSNYLKENESFLQNTNYIPISPVHYNQPWNINLSSPNSNTNNSATLPKLFNNENIQIQQQNMQNYMIIDENSQNLLLNQLYQQQQQQQQMLNQEQANCLFRIISLSNDVAQNLIQANTLKLNDLSNIKNINENEIAIQNKTPNNLTMLQSWASTVTENTNQVIFNENDNQNISNDTNPMDNSVTTVSSSSSSNYSSNCENVDNENENEYLTYLSSEKNEEIKINDNNSKSYSYDKNLADMVNII